MDIYRHDIFDYCRASHTGDAPRVVVVVVVVVDTPTVFSQSIFVAENRQIGGALILLLLLLLLFLFSFLFLFLFLFLLLVVFFCCCCCCCRCNLSSLTCSPLRSGGQRIINSYLDHTRTCDN